MRVHTHRIAYTYGDIIRIRPIGDIHVGSPECDERAARAFITNAPSDCLFLGLGDFLDGIIASDLKRYRPSAVADQGDDVIDKQVDRVAEWFMPVRDRVIGLGTGNHEDNITNRCGTNPMKRLCKLLEVPFLGYSWLLRLTLSDSNGGRGRNVIIRAHHGWGGGSRTQGADLTKYARDVAYWDADVFLYGHVHRKQTSEVPRLGLCGNKLISKPKLMALCGTFLKTYGDGEDPTYSEKAGYPPVTVGGITLCIRPTWDHFNAWFE